MDLDTTEPELYAVAGCLFEVSLPEGEGASWSWSGGQPEVTHLGESARGGRRHFRFRAEAAGAEAGQVGLRFRALTEGRGMTVRVVVVPVAPEHEPGT